MAVGKARDCLLGALAEADEFERRARPPQQRFLGFGKPAALTFGANQDVLERAHRAEQTDVLEGARKPGPRALMSRQHRHVPPVDENPAGRRAVDPGDDIERSRLAAAVRSDQRVHGAAPDAKIDGIYGLEAAELFGEALHFKNHLAAIGRRGKGQRTGGGDGARAPFDAPCQKAPDAIRHEDDDEDHRRAVNGEIETRHALQEPQPFRNEDQQRRADRRADRRGDAAEQRHRHQHDRVGEGELVGAHVGKPPGEQAATKPAKQCAKREGRHLDGKDVNAGGGRREFVVTHRPHRAAEPGVGEAPDQITGDRRDGDYEGEVRRSARKPNRAWNRTHAVGPMREASRVDEDDGEDLLERNRHHGEIVTAEPERRRAERRARDQRDHHARDQAEPERSLIVDLAEADRIGAERKERGLREIDLPAKSENDGKTEHGNAVGRRLHENVGDVAVRLRGRRKHDDDQRDDPVSELAEQRRSRDHAFSATRSPKMPCGRNTRNRISTRNANASL